MEQTSAVADQNKPEVMIEATNSTLKMPLWFLAVVLALLALRVYVKLTQMSAPPGQGVAWLTLEQFEKLDKSQVKDKDLVLYEFTAEWCPPCQKRERTVFRSPATIATINKTFIPVRVDLTKSADLDKPEIKQVTEKFNVSSIPRCAIALKSGEFVKDDSFLFENGFDDFLNGAIKNANSIHAELDLAAGRNAEALAKLSPEAIKGKAMPGLWYAPEFLMCHHLLIVLNRQAEADSLVKTTMEKSKKMLTIDQDDQDSARAVQKLGDYLAGRISEEKLFENARTNTEKANYYLAVGLKHLRDGEKEKALKALHQSSIFEARSYSQDRLAEYITAKME